MKPLMISSNRMITEKNKIRRKINLQNPKTLQVPPSKLVSQYSSPIERRSAGHLADQ